MARKKRRLKKPFRIIRNIIIVLLILFIILYGAYAYFLKADVDAITTNYNEGILVAEDTTKSSIYKSSYNILLIGVDEGLNASRADSLNLVSVNGNTNEMMITNIPRDAYIEYACIDDMQDKITNASAYGGTSCLVDGVENIFNTKIDFYVKMNFEGFLTIIDDLGTIKTKVPDYLDGRTWCEQTANRINQICFDKFGNQEITSQQALAIARSRQYSSDLYRGKLQTQIIKDTIKELSNVRDLALINKIVKDLDGTFETNITLTQILLMTYNYYQFDKGEHEINNQQIEGIAKYIYGEYVGYGSYFVIDEAWQKTFNDDLQQFLTK